MKNHWSLIALVISAGNLNTHSSAEVVSCIAVGRHVDAIDFSGQPDFSGYVVDVWLLEDGTIGPPMMPIVYNVNISNSLGASSYYQSFTGTGWTPNNLGGPFETDAVRQADSFVSLGAHTASGSESIENGAVVQMGSNGTGLDPGFGGNNAGAPGANAGWYKQSYVQRIDGIFPKYSAIFIGRFSIQGSSSFTLSGSVSIAYRGLSGKSQTLPILNFYDCNMNGIEDSVDILEGTELDKNENNIPDSCEYEPGDLDKNGCIDGGDLGVFLNMWGPQESSDADFNNSGTVDGADLGILLRFWVKNPCP